MSGSSRRPPRLYVDRPLDEDPIRLSESEAHYLARVLRLRKGHHVLLFNGRGEEQIALIDRLTRQDALLRSRQQIEPLPESPLDVVLIQAVTKSEPMDFIVQKATELGVAAILPAMTEFSVVKLDEQRAARRLRHWRGVANSACEQSGRHRPPTIHAPRALPDCLTGIPAASLRLVLDPDATRAATLPSETPASVWLLSGPEGGFGSRDLEQIDSASFRHLQLGPRTMRAETAAVVGCALLQARWGDLDGSTSRRGPAGRR